MNRFLLRSPDAQQQGLYLVTNESKPNAPVFLHNGVNIVGYVEYDQYDLVRDEIIRLNSLCGHARVLVVGVDHDYLRTIRNEKCGTDRQLWVDYIDGSIRVDVYGHCAERPARKHAKREKYSPATFELKGS